MMGPSMHFRGVLRSPERYKVSQVEVSIKAVYEIEKYAALLMRF